MFHEMNMDQYAKCITDNAIDGTILAFIGEEGLKLIGVNNALHRAKILATVAKKNEHVANQSFQFVSKYNYTQ